MSRILQIKALIVDDEPLARDRIRELLKEHPEIEVIGEARNGQEAINTIVNHNPDLVFLDVQMPRPRRVRRLAKPQRRATPSDHFCYSVLHA